MNIIDYLFAGFYRVTRRANERVNEERIRQASNIKLGENVVFGPEAQLPLKKTEVTIGDNTWIYGTVHSFPHKREGNQ